MKIKNTIFITVFVVLLAIPVVLAPFFKNSANTEKRELAKMPALITDDGVNTAFASEFDDYLRDHIAFRNLLVSTRSSLLSSIFKVSAVDNVIIGKDDWLFYSEEVQDYFNVPTISERNAGNIARTYKIVADLLRRKGSGFVFAPAPNKSTLFDKMPYYYRSKDEKGNLELILDAFEKTGVPYSDLAKMFAGLDVEDELLYQKTDSHWTYEGAFYAYMDIMSKSGIPYNKFEKLGGFAHRDDWLGDLAVMLYSEAAKPDHQSYVQDEELHFEYTSHEKQVDSLKLETYNPNGSGNIVVFRDSFCNTMQIFFAETAKKATFSRIVPYDIKSALSGSPNLVVLEITERHLQSLAEAAPVMQAPYVEISTTAEIAEPSLIEVKKEEKNGMIHYFGTVDESLIGDDYSVYVLLYDKDECDAFAAFPIFEKELLEAKELKDNGFSAYIDKKAAEGKKLAFVVENGKNRYFVDKSGSDTIEPLFARGFIKENGKLVFKDTDRTVKPGKLVFDGEEYYLNEDLSVHTGWLEVDGTLSYYDENGRKTGGWQELDGAKYYIANGVATVGFKEIDSELYYFDEKGRMVTGVVSIEGITYRFEADGKAYSGWLEEDGKKFYFDRGKRAHGFTKLDGNTYFFAENGKALTGWQTIDDAKYWFGNDGVMVTGFNDISGSTYFFDDAGKMLTGWQNLNGNKYYFYDSGKMAKNVVVGDYKIDANGIAKPTFAKITKENLNDYLNYLLDKNGRSLKSIFQTCGRKNYEYLYRTNSKDMTVEEQAIQMFNTGKGSCYEFSAITYLMVKALGYNCQLVVGKGAVFECHRWVIIEVEPGVWRHMDTERSSIEVYLVTDAQLDAWNGMNASIKYEWDKSKYPKAE